LGFTCPAVTGWRAPCLVIDSRFNYAVTSVDVAIKTLFLEKNTSRLTCFSVVHNESLQLP
jgi:hypothetical protein